MNDFDIRRQALFEQIAATDAAIEELTAYNLDCDRQLIDIERERLFADFPELRLIAWTQEARSE
jgi:hypothetical protein